MSKFVGITFKDGGQVYFVYNPKYNLKTNLTVVVSHNEQLKFAKVVKLIDENKKINNQNDKVLRIATKQDYIQHKKNVKDAREALLKCREIVKQKNLNMYIIDASYTLDREQLIFRFISDSRVDFRELAKELASIYKTRIELRQIGIRDKAKEIGGCGPCGQKLCCSRFLNDFDGVSINMAKNQNLALNPSKINGVCGRLFCCLQYENECYKECRKNLPKVGDKIDTEKGEGVVTNIDILNMKCTIDLTNGSTIIKDYSNEN